MCIVCECVYVCACPLRNMFKAAISLSQCGKGNCGNCGIMMAVMVIVGDDDARPSGDGGSRGNGCSDIIVCSYLTFSNFSDILIC